MSYYRAGLVRVGEWTVPTSIANQDFMKLKAHMKGQLFKANGAYRHEDGTLMTFDEFGSRITVPITTNLEAKQMISFWLKVGSELQKVDDTRGVRNARQTFTDEMVKWSQEAGIPSYPTSEDLRSLTPIEAYRLWNAISSYVIALDNARYASRHIEGALARAFWALRESAKSAGVKVTDPFRGIWRFLGALKWVLLGILALVFLVWAFKK